MINHKIAQPSIQVVVGYFIANLSLNLLVKEFFLIGKHLAKLQGNWLIMSYALRLLSSKMQNSPGK